MEKRSNKRRGEMRGSGREAGQGGGRKGAGIEINTNRRWARSHRQQVNLSIERQSPEEMRRSNPSHVSLVPGTTVLLLNSWESVGGSSVREEETRSPL